MIDTNDNSVTYVVWGHSEMSDDSLQWSEAKKKVSPDQALKEVEARNKDY